jgi:hypothetical protein
MDLSLVPFAVLLALVAATAPFGLRFDRGRATLSDRTWTVFVTVMALLFGTGFVGLAAAGMGAVLGIDGIAAMVPLAWVWGPVLAAATLVAARRCVGGSAR